MGKKLPLLTIPLEYCNILQAGFTVRPGDWDNFEWDEDDHMEDLLLRDEMEFLVRPEHFQADWSTQNSKPPLCLKFEVKGNCPKAPDRMVSVH